MAQPLTKKDLQGALAGVASTKDIQEVVGELRASEKRLGERIDGVASDVVQLRAEMNGRFDTLDVQLAQLVETMANDRHVRNLVRELKAHGVQLDEQKIFSA